MLARQLSKNSFPLQDLISLHECKKPLKDNKINSIKKIIKHFKGKIQKTSKSVRRHRTFSAGNKNHYSSLQNKFTPDISTVKTNTGLESRFRRSLPRSSQTVVITYSSSFSFHIFVSFKLLNKSNKYKTFGYKTIPRFPALLKRGHAEPHMCYAQHLRLTSSKTGHTFSLHPPTFWLMYLHAAAAAWNTHLPVSTGDSDLVTPRGLNPTVWMDGNTPCDSLINFSKRSSKDCFPTPSLLAHKNFRKSS